MTVTGMTGKKEPEFIYRNGKPAAVILGIDKYREMLERLEDAEDFKMPEEMRKNRFISESRTDSWRSADSKVSL